MIIFVKWTVKPEFKYVANMHGKSNCQSNIVYR